MRPSGGGQTGLNVDLPNFQPAPCLAPLSCQFRVEIFIFHENKEKFERHSSSNNSLTYGSSEEKEAKGCTGDLALLPVHQFFGVPDQGAASKSSARLLPS